MSQSRFWGCFWSWMWKEKGMLGTVFSHNNCNHSVFTSYFWMQPFVFTSRHPVLAWIISGVISVVKMALGTSSPLAFALGGTFLERTLLISYLFRFGTLVVPLFIAFSVSGFAHVNSCGHFLLQVMRFSLSSSKSHLLELLNSEIGNLYVIHFTLPRSYCFSQGELQPHDWEC